MAEVYSDFSRALIESERPAILDTAAMQDYEMVLEEEAFPFEERAIEVHEKNLELMAAGIYNPWIERSLAKLSELMPGRYAKFEASSGLIASIDSYVYQAPNARDAGGDATESPEPASQPDSASGEQHEEQEEEAVVAGRVSDANTR